MSDNNEYRNFSINTTEAQVIVAIKDTMNIAAAAVSLGLPKTTLSSILSKLERKLKNQIFIRKQGSGEVIITEYGQEVIPKMEKILWIADSVRPREELAGDRYNVGKVSLTSNQTILEGFICPYVADLLEENPEIQLTLTQKDGDYYHQPEANDIFIGLWEYNTDNYIYLPFHHFKQRAWASEDYLAKHGPIRTVDDLLNQRFVLWQKVSSPDYYPGNDFLLRRLGLSLKAPNVICVRSGVRLLDVLAEEGSAIMIASEETTRLNKLRLVPVLPEFVGESVSLFIKVDRRFAETAVAQFIIDWIFACRDQALKSIGIEPIEPYTPFLPDLSLRKTG